MKGGCDSGFNHVKPEAYPPRLLHFTGLGKKIEVREVPAAPSSLDKSDVFILDLGLEIIQWNGETSNKDERFKACRALPSCPALPCSAVLCSPSALHLACTQRRLPHHACALLCCALQAMEYTQNLKKERAGRPVITVMDSTQLGEV